MRSSNQTPFKSNLYQSNYVMSSHFTHGWNFLKTSMHPNKQAWFKFKPKSIKSWNASGMCEPNWEQARIQMIKFNSNLNLDRSHYESKWHCILPMDALNWNKHASKLSNLDRFESMSIKLWNANGMYESNWK